MTEESQMQFALSEMAGQTFTLTHQQVRELCIDARGWVDASEAQHAEQEWDPSHEEIGNHLFSGQCWQLMPLTWRVISSSEAHRCPDCKFHYTGEPLAIEGRNHLGVDYLVHCSVPVTNWLVELGHVDQRHAIVNDYVCIDCQDRRLLGGAK